MDEQDGDAPVPATIGVTGTDEMNVTVEPDDPNVASEGFAASDSGSTAPFEPSDELLTGRVERPEAARHGETSEEGQEPPGAWERKP
ncbi:MAG: hypothetical protein ACRDFS_04995 [Chloroflexota bacterium]